jgi:hypothetical protein
MLSVPFNGNWYMSTAKAQIYIFTKLFRLGVYLFLDRKRQRGRQRDGRKNRQADISREVFLALRLRSPSF